MRTISGLVIAIGLCLVFLVGDASARGFGGFRSGYVGFDGGARDTWSRAGQDYPEESAVTAAGEAYPEESEIYGAGQDYPEESAVYAGGGFYSGGWGLDESH